MCVLVYCDDWLFVDDIVIVVGIVVGVLFLL